MLDSSLNAVINVYSPLESFSEAYLACNLSGLKKLKNELDKMIKSIENRQVYFDKQVINVGDSDGKIYKLVIVFDEDLTANTKAPYTDNILNSITFNINNKWRIKDE